MPQVHTHVHAHVEPCQISKSNYWCVCLEAITWHSVDQKKPRGPMQILPSPPFFSSLMHLFLATRVLTFITLCHIFRTLTLLMPGLDPLASSVGEALLRSDAGNSAQEERESGDRKEPLSLHSFREFSFISGTLEVLEQRKHTHYVRHTSMRAKAHISPAAAPLNSPKCQQKSENVPGWPLS